MGSTSPSSSTPPSEPRRAAVVVREAAPADNAALLALSKACPSAGALSLYVDRSPDYFAITRLQGERSWVGIAEVDGEVAGSISGATRTVYLHGEPGPAWYVSDLKVAPRFRGPAFGLADRLTTALQQAGGAVTGVDAPGLLSILAGNRPMKRRTPGPRGIAQLDRVAGMRVLAIPVVWRRRQAPSALRIERGTDGDFEEMAALWRQVAPRRQFAPVLAADALAGFVGAAPGLAADSYLLARRGDGRLEGFLALWDQSALKRLVIIRYPVHLDALRLCWNLAAPLLHAHRLPGAGAPLPCQSIFHLCVPGERSDVFRALLLRACDDARRAGAALLNLALDGRDPLLAATHGLLAQVTEAHAHVTTGAGRYRGPALDDRPLHFEVALV